MEISRHVHFCGSFWREIRNREGSFVLVYLRRSAITQSEDTAAGSPARGTHLATRIQCASAKDKAKKRIQLFTNQQTTHAPNYEDIEIYKNARGRHA